jgi:hypothetical protein
MTSTDVTRSKATHTLGDFYWDHNIRPLAVAFPHHPVPVDLEEYLFDLQGFVVRRGALRKDEVAACNAVIDTVPVSLGRGEWWGNVQREDHPEHRGRSYQQIYEAGAGRLQAPTPCSTSCRRCPRATREARRRRRPYGRPQSASVGHRHWTGSGSRPREGKHDTAACKEQRHLMIELRTSA